MCRRSGSSSSNNDVERAASQGFPDKPVRAGIRVDPPEEMLANKLCPLLSRAEIRDIIDVLALDNVGLRIETVVPLAMRQDGG